MNLCQKALGYIARSIGLADHGWCKPQAGAQHRDRRSGLERLGTGERLSMGLRQSARRYDRLTAAHGLPNQRWRTMVATDHPLYRILHDSPNADQTAVDFWEFICASIELSGNPYAEIIRGSDEVVAAKCCPSRGTHDGPPPA